MNRQEDIERWLRHERRTAKARERAKQYYWKHRESMLQKTAAYRQRKREGHIRTVQLPPSIESLEAALPFSMRIKVSRLRAEFKKLPILQRPPYDEWLKQKTIEHLKNKTK
jgi:hypothetical protein